MPRNGNLLTDLTPTQMRRVWLPFWKITPLSISNRNSQYVDVFCYVSYLSASYSCFISIIWLTHLYSVNHSSPNKLPGNHTYMLQPTVSVSTLATGSYKSNCVHNMHATPKKSRSTSKYCYLLTNYFYKLFIIYMILNNSFVNILN